MLDWRTTIIHGVPYGENEWQAMADAGANLIWSPVSNMTLYGATADIPGALAAGVNVALGPDWTPSGSPHLLDEMKAADKINQEQWGGLITPLQFAEFVTRNPAMAAGIEDWAGQIAPGYRANLVVIQGPWFRPYDTLLRADQRDVKLVVVSGQPMYGDPWLLKQFAFVEDVEIVLVDGRLKGLSIQVDSHWYWETAKPFYQIQSELLEAYAAAEPKVCDFLDLDGGWSIPFFMIPRDWSGAHHLVTPAESVEIAGEQPRAIQDGRWLPAECIPVDLDLVDLEGLQGRRLFCPLP
jgi:hypothetical protein